MSYHESSHERLCQIIEEQERQLTAIAAERNTLRHDAGVCRERIALLEATVRTYERQMGRDP